MGEQQIFESFKELLPEFKARNIIKNELMSSGLDDDAIFEKMKTTDPYFIFISDMGWLVPFVYGVKSDMRAFLENIAEKGSGHNIYFICRMTMEKAPFVSGYKIYETAASYKTGIYFGEEPAKNPSLELGYISKEECRSAAKSAQGFVPLYDGREGSRKVAVVRPPAVRE